MINVHWLYFLIPLKTSLQKTTTLIELTITMIYKFLYNQSLSKVTLFSFIIMQIKQISAVLSKCYNTIIKETFNFLEWLCVF